MPINPAHDHLTIPPSRQTPDEPMVTVPRSVLMEAFKMTHALKYVHDYTQNPLEEGQQLAESVLQSIADSIEHKYTASKTKPRHHTRHTRKA